MRDRVENSASGVSFAAVILAAGRGTRMKSDLPKVLHEVAGRPMVAHVADTVGGLSPAHLLVVTSSGNMESVLAATRSVVSDAVGVVQEEQLGTAHAVGVTREVLQGYGGALLVLYGDTPLIRASSLEKMLRLVQRDDIAIAVLGMRPRDAGAYGRLVLDDDGMLDRIVEYKDATDEERAITLCNSGVMAIGGGRVFELISQVDNDNVSGEYYLTDIVSIARKRGLRCAVVEADEEELIGVNSRAELAEAERIFQSRMRMNAMAAGVTLIDPSTVYFSADTRLGRDVVIHPHVFFGGAVEVSDGVEIKSFSHIEGGSSGKVVIGEGSTIGPFARLRAGANIGESVRIGNFVEVKNSVLHEGVKAGHLSYLGDAEIGSGTNIGAGTITCNYDGFDKYKTEIGRGVFVGSDSTLVAPVVIGDGAYVGAGSCISKDVGADSLALARSRQVEKEGWAKNFRHNKRKDEG